MILKSFLIEKNITLIDGYFMSLFYGENIGLKDEIKYEIKKKYKNYEQINLSQDEILKNLVSKNQSLYNFLVNKWYFDELYDLIFVDPIKKIGLFFWKKGDINTIDRYGPDGLSRLVKIISDKAVNFQSGYLYHYAFVMLVGFSILLTYFILY